MASGSPETASGGSTKPKNSNRSGGAHKQKVRRLKAKKKTLVLTGFFKINNKKFFQHRKGIFFK
jgi:hypothetical protein